MVKSRNPQKEIHDLEIVMNTTLKRIVGIFLILTATLGILLSIIGLFGTWRVRTTLLVKFIETTETIKTNLVATSEGLLLLENTLDSASEAIASTESVSLTIAQTMQDFNSLTQGIQNLVNLIPGSQLLGTDTSKSSENLVQAENELTLMASQINQIGGSLTEAQTAVSRYRSIVRDTEIQVTEAQINASKWVNTATWLLTIVFVWLFATQVGLFIQGTDYLVNPHRD